MVRWNSCSSYIKSARKNVITLKFARVRSVGISKKEFANFNLPRFLCICRNHIISTNFLEGKAKVQTYEQHLTTFAKNKAVKRYFESLRFS